MLEKLLSNYYEAAAVVLIGIGLTNLLLQRNLIKRIIGFNIMNASIYLFLAARGYVSGRAAPILMEKTSSNLYVNPLPSGLVIAGIVISVSITAFALALTLKLYESYGTLNIDEALLRMTKEQEELEAEIDASKGELLS